MNPGVIGGFLLEAMKLVNDLRSRAEKEGLLTDEEKAALRAEEERAYARHANPVPGPEA